MRRNHWMNKRLGLLFCIIATLIFTSPGFSQMPDANEEPAFSESFQQDILENGWEKRVMIGNPNLDIHYVEHERLSIELPGGDTAVLFTNSKTQTEDSFVEAVFENILTAEASYGVLCRHSDDGWYEFRIYVSGPRAGAYTLFRYETERKAKFQSPYVTVHAGMDHIFTHDIKLGLNVKNKLGLSCQGDQFRLYINDKEQTQYKKGEISDSFFTEGADGIVFNTYGKHTAQFDVTEFNVYGDGIQDTAADLDEPEASNDQPEIAATKMPLIPLFKKTEPTEQPTETPTEAPTLIPESEQQTEDPVNETKEGEVQTISFFSLPRPGSSEDDSKGQTGAVDGPVDKLEEGAVEESNLLPKPNPFTQTTEESQITPPTEIPTLAPAAPIEIEPEIITDTQLRQPITCGDAFQFNFFWQPMMVRSLSGQNAQGRFLFSRVQITNLTDQTITSLPARSFKVISVIDGVKQEHPLQTNVSLLTSDSWDVGLITDPFEPGKILDTFLVFEVPGRADEWIMDFKPVLKLSEGPLCHIQMNLPKVDYQD